MTDPIVSIEPTELAVEPGGQSRLTVTIANPSSIVENYRIEVVAELPGEGPAAWAQSYPDEVSVYPKEKGTATVVLAPPLGAASGRFPFGIKVSSTVPPHASVVEEGDVEVGQRHGLQATITPMNSAGRWRGRHLITYTNWGNAPARLRLSARDPDQRLGFLLEPTELAVPLGKSATARLTVRTRRPFLRGTPERLPFEVVAESDEPGARPQVPPAVALPGDPRRPVLNGVLVQKPILSRVTVATGALAAVAAVAAIVLAVQVPKPQAAQPVVGLPAPPESVNVQLADPSTIRVTWQDKQDLAHQVTTLVGNTTTDSADVKPGVEVFTAQGLSPGTTYCFAVRSARDKQHLSAPVQKCQATPKAQPSGAGSGSGSPSGSSSSSSPVGSKPVFTSPNNYIVLIVRSLQQTGTASDSVGVYTQASSLGHQPKGLIFTGDYVSVRVPNVGPLRTKYYGAYDGPYPNADAALAAQRACSHDMNQELICLAVQVGSLR